MEYSAKFWPNCSRFHKSWKKSHFSSFSPNLFWLFQQNLVETLLGVRDTMSGNMTSNNLLGARQTHPYVWFFCYLTLAMSDNQRKVKHLPFLTAKQCPAIYLPNGETCYQCRREHSINLLTMIVLITSHVHENRDQREIFVRKPIFYRAGNITKLNHVHKAR